MLKRGILIVAFGLALIGNTPDGDIPAALKPYIVDGELKADDFGWMRGAFGGASEKEKADWAGVSVWLRKCLADAKSDAVADLAALGIAEAHLDSVPVGSALCGSVATYKAMIEPTKNWEEFRANEIRAGEIFSVYEYGAQTAKLHGAYEPSWGAPESWFLLGAPVMEQVYRIGTDWQTESSAPPIDPALLPYLRTHMANAAQKADRKNTATLKKMVEIKGWPSIPMVGERASFNAWLLVQHADHDPAFQLKALRLMEPLTAKGDVSKRNYSYLYDRVMLKLYGKQRFGTQIGGCDGDEYALLPLEDEKRLDILRAEHDLEPISQYRDGFKKQRGPCRD
jgi:hypothetical protein